MRTTPGSSRTSWCVSMTTVVAGLATFGLFDLAGPDDPALTTLRYFLPFAPPSLGA